MAELPIVSEWRTCEWELIIAPMNYFYVEQFHVDVSKDVRTPATRCLPIIYEIAPPHKGFCSVLLMIVFLPQGRNNDFPKVETAL